MDSSGALLAEVQITLRNPSGAITAKTATDSNGQFLISGIRPGPYTLEAERKKFETARRDILVSVATPLPDLEIIMKVAGRTETVNVFQPEGYAAMATTVATKTDTPLLQLPFSVQVVPNEVLQDQQVTRLEQAIRNVSNVYQTNPGFSNFGDQLVIRGFLNNQVVYRDGFRIDTSDSGKRETANIEQVEVLKGPASILYGRIEPGGLINYTTKKPLSSSHYALQQQFGSFASYLTSFDATGPIDKEKLAYRFNASFEQSASFRQFVGDQRWFLAPTIQWKISPATQLSLEYEYFNNQTTPDNIGLIAYGDRPLAGEVSVNNVLKYFPVERNLGEPTDFHNATQQIFNLSFSHLFNQHLQLSAAFNSALTDERAGGSYADFVNDDDVKLDILNRTVEASSIGLNVVSHLFTYAFEINLLGRFNTLGVKHNLLLGGDYYREDDSQTCCSISGLLLDNISIFAPVHGVTIGPVNPSSAFTIYGTPSWHGVYLQDQVQLRGHLFLLGGVRYDLARDHASSIYGVGNSSDHRFTPRIGVLWQARQWLSLYGSYVENFGASNRDLVDRNNMPLPTETAQQWEVGIKAAVGRRLLGTLAYYNLTKQNIATPDPLFPLDGHHALPIGEAKSRGVELDITGAITPRWNLLVAYALTDARIVNDLFFGTAGNRLADVPKNGGRVWTTYSLLDEPRRLTFGAGITAQSAREGNMTNDYLLPGYATFGVMASYSLPVRKSNLTFQANLNNLFNRTYFEASGIFGRSRILPGSPVAVMSSIRFNF